MNFTKFNLETSAKLNHNKKYREVRREQNRLAILREKEEKLDQKRTETVRKRKAEKQQTEPKEKHKLSEKEQREKIKEDEEQLGNTEGKNTD